MRAFGVISHALQAKIVCECVCVCVLVCVRVCVFVCVCVSVRALYHRFMFDNF